MKIIIETQTFIKSNISDSITGIIYFETEKFCFPGKDWSDFPIFIAKQLTDCITSKIDEQILFMDGPFAINIQFQGEIAMLTFLEMGHLHKHNKSLHEYMVSVPVFTKTIIKAIRVILRSPILPEIERNYFKSKLIKLKETIDLTI